MSKWNDPRAIWSDPPVKAEGMSIAHNLTISNSSLIYKDAMTPYGQVTARMEKLEYILQRIAPNFDELVEQFNAIKDIERSNNDIR